MSPQLASILGGAIGDVFGGIAERGSLNFSDDTQLTLATCEAIIEKQPPDPETIATRMLAWFREGRITGIGSSTLKAMRDLAAGAHWALAGARGERAAGNGAAMRIAPVAFFVDPMTSAGRRLIRDISRITHHHDEAYIGALAVVIAIRNAAISPAEIAEALPDSRVRDNLLTVAGTDLEAICQAIGTSGFVAETVPAAIAAASLMIADGFESTLHRLNRIGGDTDTIGSIAGQIAGAHAPHLVPIDLLRDVPGSASVFQIATQFAHVAPIR